MLIDALIIAIVVVVLMWRGVTISIKWKRDS